MRAWNRLRALFARHRLDCEFDEEARTHIALATEDYIERRYQPAEARRLALIKFGSVEASKETHRDSRGFAWLERVAHDLRFAVRGLSRDRGFTATATAILAVAIGLNLTVFAVVNTMLFRGFPLVRDNSRLLYIQERYTLRSCCLLYPDFLAWRQQAKSFQSLAMVGGKPISLDDGDSGGRDAFATTVTANAFSVLGVRPMLGRDFTPADDAPGAAQVVILTFRAWETRFGKRADIIGHQLRIDKEPATVVGVMPDRFDFPEHGLLWMPLEPTQDMLQRKPGGYMAFGRLALNSTKANAEAELDLINKRLETEFPATNKGVRARLSTFAEFSIGPEARMIYGSVWIAAWFVLLIACANLANLALARALSRSREFSVRIALGAGRWRIARQILCESFLLAAAGGGIGWWLAQWGTRTWAAATYSRYVVLDYSGSSNVAYLAASTFAAALLFGLIPITRAIPRDVNGTLKGHTGNTTLNRGTKRLSAALVSGQMALAIVLLAGAGVLARSLWNVVSADTGVKGADKVLIGHVAVPRDKYPSIDTRNAFWDRLRSLLVAIPQVDSVSVAATIPVSNSGVEPFELEDGETEAERKPMVTTVAVGPGYMHAVGARIVSGREFTESDGPHSPPVAIVNQSFAAQYWPGREALASRVKLTRGDRTKSFTVVGVASNIMQNQPLREKFLPIVYIPFRLDPAAGAAVFVRTLIPPAPVSSRVRSTIEKAAPGITLEDFSTLEASFAFDRDRMDLEHAELGKHAVVAPVFAGVALLIAAIGLYAVAARFVGQRAREIGIRMALGAVAANVRSLVLREGMVPVVVGWLVGMVVSSAVNRALESQLVGVKPQDPVTVAAATALLFLVAAAGCWLPARRASLVDPATVLRND